jgi:hypothetical protein
MADYSRVNGAILLQGRVRINARPILFSLATEDQATAAAPREDRCPNRSCHFLVKINMRSLMTASNDFS